jgi:hypothetical protein
VNYDVNIGGRVLPTFYIFREKDYVKIASRVANHRVVWQCKKNMDDFILVQRVPILFKEVNYGGNISIQLSSLNLRWPWFTCHIKSYRISTTN